MSVLNGIFTSPDNTEIRLSAIISVGGLVDIEGVICYEIIHAGGYTFLMNDYMDRTAFLTSWRAA